MAGLVDLTSWLSPIVDKALSYIPDPQQKAAAKQALLQEADKHIEDLAQLMSTVDTKQADIDIAEANSSNKFTSYWRPGLAWVFVASFTWQYVLLPIATFVCALCKYPVTLPAIDMSVMMPILIGMLGLSTQRTVEKMNNVEDRHG